MKYYIIACSVRSGSHFLGELLTNLGIGSPSEKNTNFGKIDSLESMYESGCQDDIWGGIIHGLLYDKVLRDLRRLELINLGDAVVRMNDAELLDAALPGVKYIHLSRINVLQGAVSFLKAFQSQNYVIHDEAERSPNDAYIFDYEGISREIMKLAVHRTRWLHFFDINNIKPLYITYEELTSDTEGCLARILNFLNEEVPHDLGKQLQSMRLPIKQADEHSEEWIRRYISQFNY